MKSAVRQEIEKILLKDPRRKIHTVFTDGRSYGVRMKFCTTIPATKEEISQIMNLPWVNEVKYTKSRPHLGSYGDFYRGISVRFSRSTREIKIDKPTELKRPEIEPAPQSPKVGHLVGIINPELAASLFVSNNHSENSLKQELINIRNQIDLLINKL